MADAPPSTPSAPAAPAAPVAPAAPERFDASQPPGRPGSQPISDDPFTKFDKAPPEKPVDQPKETPKDTPPKETPKDKDVPQDKDKPLDQKPEEGKTVKEKKSGWQRFREEEKKLSEYKASQAKARAELEAKVAELTKRASGDWKLDDHPEYKKIAEARAAEQKRLAELETRLQMYDHEQSPEYQEKFHKPYVRQWENSIAAISQMKVPAGEGQTRAATKDDLIAVVGAKSDEEAIEIAERIFGTPTKAAMALNHRAQIIAAHIANENAKQEFAKRSVEMRKQESERGSAEAKARAEQFDKFVNEGLNSDPIYKPVDGDDEGNAVLAKGFMLTDAVFGAPFTDDKGQQRPMTAEEQVKFNAMIRNKAGAFDRLQLETTRLKSKIAELEDELQDYRESAPDGGEAPGGKKPEDPLALPALIR